MTEKKIKKKKKSQLRFWTIWPISGKFLYNPEQVGVAHADLIHSWKAVTLWGFTVLARAIVIKKTHYNNWRVSKKKGGREERQSESVCARSGVVGGGMYTL